MTAVQVVGAALLVIGVGEYVVFRYLAPRNPSIARRRTLLNANALFNALAGAVLLVVGR
jgi:hypothetical protein